MKRIWLGLGILVLFLVLGLWSSYSMQKLHAPLAHKLESAADAALSGDWETGLVQAQQAQTQWETRWHGSAVLADHTPMDEIDSYFARLEIYSHTKNEEAFAAGCRQLAQLITATAEAHSFTWWNIL
ncbi:MAG: DUF4363 family protein [Oscillospiraceae bacterium]|nr:DUF4363 family protein [Oscillospiraceae bacterium]